jgi:hypothetical protein
MEEERVQGSLPRVQVSRQSAPPSTNGYEELHYEELEERIVPGGVLCIATSLIKKTAGWGC